MLDYNRTCNYRHSAGENLMKQTIKFPNYRTVPTPNSHIAVKLTGGKPQINTIEPFEGKRKEFLPEQRIIAWMCQEVMQ